MFSRSQEYAPGTSLLSIMSEVAEVLLSWRYRKNLFQDSGRITASESVHCLSGQHDSDYSFMPHVSIQNQTPVNYSFNSKTTNYKIANGFITYLLYIVVLYSLELG